MDAAKYGKAPLRANGAIQEKDHDRNV